MQRAGRLLWVQVCAAVLTACKTAPPRSNAAPARSPRGDRSDVSTPAPPQQAALLADVEGMKVLALGAPQFSALPKGQRLLAYWTAQAIAQGNALALEQGYRHNLRIVRLLRGILSHPQVVPPAILPRIRAFARVVYLNGGLHDPQTGRKAAPGFTAADLRLAALAAQAAGADLGLGGARPEYALRALEGPLFDAKIDAQRTARSADPLLGSAVNFYAGVSQRDLNGFRERYPFDSRLAKIGTALVEQVYRLPALADLLERGLPYTAPPQRELIESLGSALRSGEPSDWRAAERALMEEAGAVDLFAGFIDRSADPRGRKALFAGFAGMIDADRAEQIEALSQRLSQNLRHPAVAQPLLLLAAAGALRPMRNFGVTLPIDPADRADGTRSALFAAAADAAAELQAQGLIAALAEPQLAGDLARCAPEQRLAYLALRELAGRDEHAHAAAPSLEEVRADVAAHFFAPSASEVMPDARCRSLWPQFAATIWLSAAAMPESDRQRALQIEAFWFESKGAISVRTSRGRHYFAADAGRFRSAASDLLVLLDEIESTGDAARWNDLLDKHGSDSRFRDEVAQRLSAVPTQIAVLPPRLLLGEDDVRAVPVDDLDAQILRDWADIGPAPP